MIPLIKKTAALLSLCAWLIIPASAQNESDALRYSLSDFGGTARFMAMGGAFGALGGDFSSLSVNPAGLGIYRSSEFTVTPALAHNRVRSSYYGTSEEDIQYNFNLSNLGVVFSQAVSSPGSEGGWRFVNFGLGINRHRNFNHRWIAEGFNNESSLMTDFLNQATRQGVNNLDAFSTDLAWQTWLLGEENGQFFVDMPGGNVLQRQETNTSGSIRELVFSIGANYNDRLYLGATVGVPSVRFEEESVYTEEDTQNLSQVFRALTFRNQYTVSGSGYNFKFGAMYRLTDMIRLGAAVHTPSFFKLEEEYNASMRSDLNLEYTSNFASARGRFDYEVNTPLRMIGSLGLVFGANGLLSLDYENNDYSQARLRSGSHSFSAENRRIREAFTTQHVLRLGGEIRLNPVALRAGYGYYSNPYKEGINDASRQQISAGIGLRDGNYFVDLGYTYSFFSESIHLYDPALTRAVARDFSSSQFRLTLGWRF